jgi:hypothetical protein
MNWETQNCGSKPGENKDFLLSHCVQTGPAIQETSHQIHTVTLSEG